MKVAIVCPRGTPFIVGGAERLWDGLVTAFNTFTSHTASIVELPSPESSFADLVHSYTSFDALDLDDFDLVISGKYPAWMVAHPRHVVYMCHKLRGDRAEGQVVKVPHVGWNSLERLANAPIIEGVADLAQVYFTHSYVAPVTVDTAAATTHGERFASVVQRGQIAGVQFHPEKSGDVGLRILRNFMKMVD